MKDQQRYDNYDNSLWSGVFLNQHYSNFQEQQSANTRQRARGISFPVTTARAVTRSA